MPSRIAPALSGVIALAVLTRLLPVEEYGRFALCTASMTMLQAAFTQWLTLGIIRFHAAAHTEQEKSRIIASVAALFVIEAPAVLLICVVVAFFSFDAVEDRHIILLSFLYYLAFSLFTISQRVHVSSFRSARFSLMSVFQSMASASFAILFSYIIAPTATFAIVGMILGYLCASVLDIRNTRDFLHPYAFEFKEMYRVFKFAWPTIPQSGLAALIGRIDRFILAALVGAEAVGQYNAGFSLADQAISSVFLLVALVTHPLAISAFEHKSVDAFRAQLEKNITLMVGIALPAAVGLCAIASELSKIVLGESFRNSAIELIPVLVAALFISGIKDHYIAHSFHLAKKMWLPVAALVPIAAVSVLANYLLIPRFGIFGAAYVMLGAQLCALVLTYILSRWAVPFPFPVADIAKICAAAGMMGGILYVLPERSVWISLSTKLVLGVLCYGVALCFLNPSSIRQTIVAALKGTSVS